ncbi:lipase maturation factor family protein [Melittangium boletus]|uniref:lipase maturation factor family protein n=1 Tax=Melittangium boletus TaxID=83453 RepID=UPI003DA251AD
MGWKQTRGLARSVPHRRVRQAFLGALGGIYFIAFTSLGRQVLGLHGARGIRPVRDVVDAPRWAVVGRRRWLEVPSLFWWGASDRALLGGTRVGQALALAVMAGVLPQPALAALWALYLSYVSVGREFLSFQWDALLLEMGLLAALTAPAGWRPGPGRWEPSAWEVAAWRMLLFRLYLGSGLSKLQSGDPTWRQLTACDFYFETAPLPTRVGWLAHQTPPRLRRWSTASVLVLETLGPLLVLAPRRARFAGFGLLSALQALIFFTGNYGFFNVQSAVLGLWLLDDEALRRVFPSTPRARPRPVWRTVGGAVAVAPLLALGANELLARLPRPPTPPRWLDGLDTWTRPLRAVNSYGLFAVMTVRRPEITLEGSLDGHTWHPYTFRYKVDAVDEAPAQVAPYQPRLDWQMWFAALGSPPGWLLALVVRLLEGSPEVEALFAQTPFGPRPPRYVRGVLHEYRMTDRKTRRCTGAWWTRERVGLYLPPMELAPPGGERRLRRYVQA